MFKATSFLGLLLLIACPIMTACSRQTAVEPRTGISNTDLEKSVRNKLNSDPEIKAARIYVDTDAEKKQVKLTGTVKSEELHKKAADLAGEAVPGINVVDNISVTPGELARATDTSSSKKPAKMQPKRKPKHR